MHDLLAFIQQHWLLIGLLVAILIAISAVEMIHNQQKLASLTPQALVGLLNRDQCVVVDIRTKNAFKEGHIIQSINLPSATLKQNIDQLTSYTDRSIVVVAEQEVEAMKTAKVISYEGYDNVKILKGGLKAWREENLPMEKK